MDHDHWGGDWGGDGWGGHDPSGHDPGAHDAGGHDSDWTGDVGYDHGDPHSSHADPGPYRQDVDAEDHPGYPGADPAHDPVLDLEAQRPPLGYADDTADHDLAGHGTADHAAAIDAPAFVADTWDTATWHDHGGLGVPVGADPDLDPHVDDGTWADPVFPAALSLADRPDPIDGYPWTDPGLLGADPHTGADDGAGAPDPAQDPVAQDLAAYDLAAYDGTALPAGADAWSLLRDSSDPATSALARWWAPG
jgi:hypothetical protein